MMIGNLPLTPQVVVLLACFLMGLAMTVYFLVAYVRMWPGIYRASVQAWGPRKGRLVLLGALGLGTVAGVPLAYFTWVYIGKAVLTRAGW